MMKALLNVCYAIIGSRVWFNFYFVWGLWWGMMFLSFFDSSRKDVHGKEEDSEG